MAPDPAPNSFQTTKPGRLLYAILALSHFTLRLPFLLLSYTLPPLRPHPNYTLRQSLTHSLLRTWFTYATTVQFPFPQSLSPLAEKERWSLIPALTDPAELYRRSPLLNAEIQPATTGGTWYPRRHRGPQSTDLNQKVILHFHGGGFTLSDARDTNCSTPASTLARATSALVFFVEYRLSSTQPSRYRFPAALQDAVTAYCHILITLGVPPSQIILSGDSAGGNLALGLLRYIGSNPDLFPCPPSAALLWSPWLDLTLQASDYACHPNSKTDYMPAEFLPWGARAYTSGQGQQLSRSHPYISPSLHPFATTTPLWISVGGLEVLRDEGVKFAEDMGMVKGNRVELCELADVGHDAFLTAHLCGRQDKAEEGAVDAARFLRGV